MDVKKKIILSYDYELFFGVKSGTVQKTLIEPTNKLMDTMEECGFRGNFFVDVLMCKYLKLNTDQRSRDDLQQIENQLRDMVRRGHRIELHLHPHWVDAKYNGDGTWDYSEFRHYMLNTFSEEEIVKMFTEGVDYLNAIGSEVLPEYKVCAFRAGGWAVQPFDKLKKAFIAAGIKIDSSTAKGVYNSLPDSFYDFRKMPNKSRYSFEDDVCKERKDGCFIEVPITTYRFQPMCYIHRRSHSGMQTADYDISFADGTHYRTDIMGLKKGRLHIIFDKLIRHRMLCFSHNDPHEIRYVLTHSDNDLYCFIDHPKDVSQATLDGIKEICCFSESVNYCDLQVNV